MRIYHGSKNEFKEFCYDMIRTYATSEGVGFYCTDNRDVAKRYANDGYIMEYEYVGKKRLDSTKVSLTRNELRTFLIALNEEDEFLSNYGEVAWEGFENVLNRAIQDVIEYDDDIDIISGICNVYGGFKRPLEILYETLGYDSAIVEASWGNQNIYLILNNKAVRFIKSEKVEGEM